MTAPTFLSRLERFETVDSTQRVVREWLDAGTPEVAVAVAAHQSAGRGRQGRSWSAPGGAALLLSAGFRPTTLLAHHGWRLAATLSLAMLDAAEEAAGLKDDTLWLKWPNDIVADASDGRLVKVAGVLGEAAGEAERVESAVVGIGVNTDWPAELFPPELAPSMSSLREVAGGRPIDNEQLLESFLDRLEPRYEALRTGSFDAGGWSRRQRTTGRQVEVESGAEVLRGEALGVDPESGALIVQHEGGRRHVASGEVLRCRIIAGLPTTRNG
ncbi:MAG TPA: biotin--[acetyl-CoA-carboxylase] ligase [Candidatus Limnocylindria bacterium]|nr:biotin--[acetyl-CoA-carboxylase] ligase [Candidatus Limnocylindria bacterium]